MPIEDHPTAYNQILNQCTSLKCSRKFLRGRTTPDLLVSNLGFGSFDFLDYYFVNFRYVYPYCKDIIKNILDDGFYIYYYYADDFYMPGKSGYGERHIHHDGIIMGYDESDDTYSIAAYDNNWVFNLIRVPREDFMKGLKSSLDNQKYGNITYYKIKENVTVELDLKAILENVKKYIKSEIGTISLECDDFADGILIHDLMAMYIDKLKDGSIPHERMDWRILRPIWEHKKCMLDRIKAVENKCVWGNEFSERYAPIVDKANRIRMMYAMYHKNSNDKLLDKIRDGILELGVQDKLILTEFTNKLEDMIL